MNDANPESGWYRIPEGVTVRVLTGVFAISLIPVLANDDPAGQISPKEMYMRTRQLPYPGPAGVETKSGGEGKSGGKTGKGKTDRKGKGGGKSEATNKLPNLGVKYWLLKDVNGAMTPVPPNTEFRTGDKIQIQVETNYPGYLYILNQGSSGQWMPMFPSPEIESATNHVVGSKVYTLPHPERVMTFDEPKGEERLTIFLARNPEKDFQCLIDFLQTGGKTVKEAMAVCGAIGDDLVRKKQAMYSRDLRIEALPATTPADPKICGTKDCSVYVVNPTGGSESRVFAELKLVHK